MNRFDPDTYPYVRGELWIDESTGEKFWVARATQSVSVRLDGSQYTLVPGTAYLPFDNSNTDFFYFDESFNLSHNVRPFAPFHVRPEDFGARGDGVTDDTQCIVNAMQVANSRFGQVVLAGNYATKSALTVPTGTYIMGNGSIIAQAPMPRILDLGLNGYLGGIGLNANGNVTSEVVRAFTGGGAEIDRVTITDTLAANQAIAAMVDKTIIRRCKINGCKIGIRGLGPNSPDGVRILENQITGWTERGIYVVGTATAAFNDLQIKGNRVTDMAAGGASRYPLRIEGVDTNQHTAVSVQDNYVRGNAHAYTNPTTPGTADQISITRCYGLIVTGNKSYDGGDGGMTIELQCGDITIMGNVIKRADSVGLYLGSSVSTFIRNATVVGNTLINNGINESGTPNYFPEAIRCQQVSEFGISGNVLGNNATTITPIGISFKNCADGTIGPNTNAGLTTGMYRMVSGNTNLNQVSTAALT